MGQVKVSFIEVVRGLEMSNLGIQMDIVRTTLQNSLEERPLSGEGVLRQRVRWADADCDGAQIQGAVELIHTLDTIRQTSVPYKGSQLLSGEILIKLT